MQPSDFEKSLENTYNKCVTDNGLDELVKILSKPYLAKSEVRQLITEYEQTVRQKIKEDLLAIANEGELEDLRREVKDYFK